MNNKFVDSETIKKTFYWIKNTINLFGPRIAGTESCLKAADHIKKNLEKHCDKTVSQYFEITPSSFYKLTKILVLSFLISSIFYLIGQNTVVISLLFLYFGLTYFLVHFVLLNSFFDIFFKKKKGVNIFGIIEPEIKPEKQIIISSHHDSTYICNFLEKRSNLYGLRIILPLIFFLFFIIFLTLIYFNVLDILFFEYRLIISIIGWIIIGPLYFYYGKEGSLGASDNLASTAMSLYISKILKQNHRLLKTKIIFLSLDGEEIGMRGAKNFIKNNKKLLADIDTEVINIDTLSNYDDLTLLKTDRNGLTKLSKQLSENLNDIAKGLGYNIKYKKFPPGGGGTDAAQFVLKGIKAASFIGIPTNFSKKNYYHTSNDIVENIDPRAIETVMNIILNYIYFTDITSL